MNKYLIDILKVDNTIIIPGLGALTVTSIESGELMFMPYLQHDDGKLSGFIAEKDGIDELDAKNTIAKYVREIQSELDKGESVVMYELGTFVKASNGDIEFTNWTGASSAPATQVTDEESPVGSEESEISHQVPQAETVVETIPEVVEEVIEETPEIVEEIIEIVPEVVTEIPEETNAIEDALSAIAPMVEAHVEEKTIELEPEVHEMNIEPPATEIPVVEEIIPPTPVVEEIQAVVEEKPKPTLVIPPVAPVTESSAQSQVQKPASDKKASKKRGAGFWILMSLLTLIIAGGTYFAINYNDLKQHIPFLADKEASKEVPELKKEMEEMINGDEEVIEDEVTDDTQIEEEVVEEIVQEQPKVIEKPAPVASSNGAYHIVSGAFSSVANATRLMESFKAQGLPARIIQNNGLNVVCMQSYATSAEAKASLASMKEKASGAWILYKP